MVERWLARSNRFALIGSLIIVVIGFISYYPAIRIGFQGDDWWFLGKAASLNLSEYLAFYFNPTTQIFWYRPLYGVLLLVEYIFFRSGPEGYHAVQVLLHLVNGLLLFAVVWQLSKRWRLALVATIFYASLPIYSAAVFWVAVQDPLAMVFYLAAVWLWVIYLQRQSQRHYVLAFGAFVLALLGKEASVFLPATLFLVDRLLVRGKISPAQLLRRYSVFAITTLVYLVIEYRVQTFAYFPNRWGYSLGLHVIENGLRYLALVVFPWELDSPASCIVLMLAVSLLVALGIKKRSKLLLFLGIQAVLAIAPAVAFPTIFFFPRYLYAASMVTGILVALLVEVVWTWLVRHQVYRWVIFATVLILVLINSFSTSAAAVEAAEESRQARVPLRDIYQQHPAYPPDTYLYFVEPPYPMIMRNLSGMFLLRYGSNVSVWSNDVEWGGVDENRFARLRDHKNSFVYYFDEARRRHEVAVEPSAQSRSSPSLPANFQAAIGLEGYEVTSTRLKRGNDLVLLLYWKALGWLGKDYTVFVHLVNAQGETVLGEDSQPRGGRAPTSTWKKDKLVVDAHILHISPDVAPGNYRLEVGLYYLPTLERLLVMDDAGRPITDKVVIEPFVVVE